MGLSVFFLILLSRSSGFIQIRTETAQKLYFSCKKKTKQKKLTDSNNTQKNLCSENFHLDKKQNTGSIRLYFIYNIKTVHKTKTKTKWSTNAYPIKQGWLLANFKNENMSIKLSNLLSNTYF